MRLSVLWLFLVAPFVLIAGYVSLKMHPTWDALRISWSMRSQSAFAVPLNVGRTHVARRPIRFLGQDGQRYSRGNRARFLLTTAFIRHAEEQELASRAQGRTGKRGKHSAAVSNGSGAGTLLVLG
jgi:hypothetical protein